MVIISSRGVTDWVPPYVPADLGSNPSIVSNLISNLLLVLQLQKQEAIEEHGGRLYILSGGIIELAFLLLQSILICCFAH